MKISAFAPATLANFCVGFDVLGMALSPINGELWGDIVEIETIGTENNRILTVTGPFASRLPKDPNQNLVTKTLRLFENELASKNIPKKNLHISLSKNMPVSSGVGSSASSIVATLVALNAIYGANFKNELLLKIAGECEGFVSGDAHYDNVAPCLLGGLQLIVPDPFQPVRKLPFFSNYQIIVVQPEIELSTKAMRAILPSQIPRSEALSQWKCLASFIHALHTNDENLFHQSFTDSIAEPYRRSYIPGFDNIKHAALDAGALGCSIAGSGPALFAVSKNLNQSKNIAQVMMKNFTKNGINSVSKICTVDLIGSRIL